MPASTEEAAHVRFHCWLDPEIHRNVRIQAAIEERTIRSVVERALNAYCAEARALGDPVEDHDSR